jgi:hypothetical protein
MAFYLYITHLEGQDHISLDLSQLRNPFNLRGFRRPASIGPCKEILPRVRRALPRIFTTHPCDI